MKPSNKFRTVAPVRRAFTLIELIVSASITVIMVTLVMGIVVTQSKVGISIGNYVDMNESGRRVMTKFETDMRLARKLNTITNTSVQANVVVSSDVTGIVAASPSTQTVSYYVDSSGTKLWRESPVGSNKTLMLQNLAACRFLYFDKNDSLVTDMTRTADVRKVLIAATMRRSFTGLNNTDYLVSAVVTMRCRSNR